MNDEININEQLEILEETKSQIKQAIIDKGQEISENDSFRSYATKIGNIEVLNAQSKPVTPTTQQQIIEPDAPTYNGLSQVTVAGVTSAIDSNIQASNIKSGVTILGVQGTYSDAMKEYASETAMNNDIANIQEGEVVKVVVTSGIAGDVDNPLTTTTTHFIKETTMKKLVKEEDTISPQEYEENVNLADDILGTE